MKWSGVLLPMALVLPLLFIARRSEAIEGDPNGFPPPEGKTSPLEGSGGTKMAPPDSVKVDEEKRAKDQGGVGQGDTRRDNGRNDSEEKPSETKYKNLKELKAEEGKESSDGGSDSKTEHVVDSSAEECDPLNRCIDEKNNFVACLRVPGKDSLDLSLLIQNKGTVVLDVNIVAPSFVNLEQATVQLQPKENKEVNRGWKLDQLKDIGLSVMEIDAINQIHPAAASQPDQLVRAPSINGRFTIRSAYWLRFESKFGGSTSQPRHAELWRKIWKVKRCLPPCTNVCMACDPRMLTYTSSSRGPTTTDRELLSHLQLRGINRASSVLLLLRACSVVWSLCQFTTEDGRLPLSDWILRLLRFDPEGNSWYRYGSIIKWNIWKAKNRWMFDRIMPRPRPEAVLAASNALFKDLNADIQAPPDDHSSYWLPPNQPFIKANVDRAYYCCCRSYILRDNDGTQIRSLGKVVGAVDAFEVEARESWVPPRLSWRVTTKLLFLSCRMKTCSHHGGSNIWCLTAGFLR